MAKIITIVDTDENTMDVTINGKSVPDVSSFSACSCKPYSEREKAYVYVSISTESQTEDGLSSTTYISKAGVSSKPPEIPITKNFIDKAQAEIIKAFS